jgi:hypothetical protein
MQRLEVCGAVRPPYGSLGVKGLSIKYFLDGQLCCVKYSPLDDDDDDDDKLSGAVVHEIFHAVPTYLRRRKRTLGVCHLLALPVTTC